MLHITLHPAEGHRPVQLAVKVPTQVNMLLLQLVQQVHQHGARIEP